MKYTSLLLDLDNTLLDFNKAEANAVRRALKSHGLPCDEAAVKLYSEINRSFWESFERGDIPREAIFEGRFKALTERLGVIADTAVLSRDYCLNLSDGFFKVDGADGILEYLKSKGYKLYAATNGISLTQHKRIRGSGLEKYFDGVFVSEETGHQKPEKGYYDYILAHTDEADRAKFLIVGDSQSSDILGGINAGIDTCWYNPEHSAPRYPSRFEIHALAELKEIL